MVGVAGFEPATPSSRTKFSYRKTAKNRKLLRPTAFERSFSVHGKAGPPQKPPPDRKTRSPALSVRKRRANRNSNFQGVARDLFVYEGTPLAGRQFPKLSNLPCVIGVGTCDAVAIAHKRKAPQPAHERLRDKEGEALPHTVKSLHCQHPLGAAIGKNRQSLKVPALDRAALQQPP